MNARTLLPLTFLYAFFAVSVSVSAAGTASLPDNEAQTKARAALYADEVKAPAPAKSAQPAPVVPSPKATSKAPSVQPAPKAPSAQAETTVEPPEPIPATPIAPAAIVPVLAGPQPDSEAQAKARAALRQEEPAVQAPPATASMPSSVAPTTQPEVSAAKPIVTAPAALKPVSRKPNPLTAGMQPPALPTTPAQQQALDGLLQQYVTDQISAAEYHKRRAGILAGK
jgi:hypothetical protein